MAVQFLTLFVRDFRWAGALAKCSRGPDPPPGWNSGARYFKDCSFCTHSRGKTGILFQSRGFDYSNLFQMRRRMGLELSVATMSKHGR